MSYGPLGREMLVLEPPYERLVSRPLSALELGSLIVLDMSLGESALERAILWQARAPWCPLVLLIRDLPTSAYFIELLTRLHGPLAFVTGLPGRWFPEVPELLEAVRHRPGPTAEETFNYVSARLTCGSLGALFAEADAFSPPYGPEHSGRCSRQVSRRFRAIGPLGVPDWRWLFSLTRLCGSAHLGVEELARAQGVGARTLRAQVRRYTGLSLKNFRELVGWEWVLEAALRRWGYLEAAPRLPLAKQA